ncbi:PREDICTED: uncharacterized protein LOC109375078 [Hipposideros armiger]|uniref:Uncharacterized protein LOC109375078 n=1 Tax=Hipposideros armiger TaxID=186990 RepID=A0A8B7QBD6_HIPAR|nr:PREDICTED: uncharacterized protein LOC109375078 [Hipposideros armiger]
MGRHDCERTNKEELAMGRGPLEGRRGLSEMPAGGGTLEERGAYSGFPTSPAPVPQDLRVLEKQKQPIRTKAGRGGLGRSGRPGTFLPAVGTYSTPGLWMAVEASVEHLLPRTGLAQLCMEASSDSGRTYLRSLRVRMWAAGCREGPDLAPSATPIFSNSFQRLADGCQACLGSRNPYRESGGNPGYRTADSGHSRSALGQA